MNAGGTATETTVYSGGKEFVSGAGAKSIQTHISSGGSGIIQAGGTSYETTIFKGGVELVCSGGTTSKTSIHGGELEIFAGGKAAGVIDFNKKKGELLIETKVMPGAVIENFQNGDRIVLADVAYSAGDSVSVNKTEIVTISAGDKTYNLHIAGATVGERDFSFNSGSVLTRNAATQPSFLRPAVSAATETNVFDEKVIMTSTTSPASAPAGAVTSSTVWPAWQPTNAFTIHQENIAQMFSSHTS